MAADPKPEPRDASDWLPRQRVTGFLATLLIASALLLGTLTRAGIWEPHELERAELSRRLAVQLFGAQQLRLSGAANHMPTLTDLGAGELGYTSMAWGLAQFGLHDWAGRLPLALWALVAVLSLYLLLARLVSPQTGFVAALVLCTTPLFFLQARSMLGDAVTLAAFTLCFAGLAGAWLDPGPRWVRRCWFAVGLFGGCAGYLSRGLLLGVAAPALGVGLSQLAWGLSRAGQGVQRAEPADRRLGPAWVLPLGVGGVALGWGLVTLHRAGFGYPLLERDLGMMLLRSAPPEATFDLSIRQLGYGLFPWSALLPFAMARTLRLPPNLPAGAAEREGATRLLLLVGAAVAYLLHGYLQPYAGALPYVAVALLAAMLALALTDLARGQAGSGAIAVGVLLLALLLALDMTNQPTRVLRAFGLADHHYPADFALATPDGLWAIAVLFGGSMAVLWLDDEGAIEGKLLAGGRRHANALHDWVTARIEQYESALGQLNSAWRGNLSFGFLLVEAALVGLALTLFVGRRAGWDNVIGIPHLMALVGFNAWWVVPLGLVMAPLLLDGTRLSIAWLLARVRLSRGSAAALAGVSAGLLCSLWFFPGVAGQLSPRQALASFDRRHGPGEALGLLGVDDKVARYYAGGEQVQALPTVRSVTEWLSSSVAEPRRWLLVRPEDFAAVNANHRQRWGSNVPVVEAEPGYPLLITNRLQGETDCNPLAPFVLDTPPERIQHPVVATFDGKLETLGWDAVDERGRLVRFVVPGQVFTLRFYYRVLKTIRRDYQAFLHLDGYGRRHNGDHDLLGGRYPVGLWQVGDVVVDHYAMVLEPNFLPGDYRVYYGLFKGKSRMAVTAGPHHDDRVQGGSLQVR